jgi:hypothetical protein
LVAAETALRTAHAGPPFRTDDPEPVETQHWEINLFSLGLLIELNIPGHWPALMRRKLQFSHCSKCRWAMPSLGWARDTCSSSCPFGCKKIWVRAPCMAAAVIFSIPGRKTGITGSPGSSWRRKINDQLTLGVELFHQTSSQRDMPSMTISAASAIPPGRRPVGCRMSRQQTGFRITRDYR